MRSFLHTMIALTMNKTLYQQGFITHIIFVLTLINATTIINSMIAIAILQGESHSSNQSTPS